MRWSAMRAMSAARRASFGLPRDNSFGGVAMQIDTIRLARVLGFQLIGFHLDRQGITRLRDRR